MNRIICEIYDSFLPICGGIFGATKSGVNASITIYPDTIMEAIIYTVFYAAIGAVVGYMVKLFLDKFFKKRCE